MPLFLRVVFFFGDLLLLNVAIVLSYYCFDLPVFEAELINSIYLFIFSNLAWLFLVLVSNPYTFTRNSGIIKVLKNQISFLFVHLLVVASLILFFKKNYSPLQIGVMYLIVIPVFFAWKMLAYYAFSLFIKSGGDKNYIIIGGGDLAKETRKYFLMHRGLRYRFLGMFEATNEEVISIEEIKKFCKEKPIDEIFCCMPDVTNVPLKDLINFGLNNLIRIKLITDYSPFQQRSLEVEQYDHIPVLNVSTVPLDDFKNRIYKRIFDVAFSLLVSVFILSWLIPIVGLIIKLDSKGPVFFKQKRSGRNNQPFDCFKFRTMVVNSEADTKQATKGDARITKVGAFLRKSSLDEMPQFINVLLGDMSIIGPRPHPIKLNEHFSPKIERLMSRHYVKPGITGLAQAMGYRGETKEIADMRSRIKLDRFYIENWSMVFDIRIIFQTVTSLIRGSEKVF